jgi:hypothetical protein
MALLKSTAREVIGAAVTEIVIASNPVTQIMKTIKDAYNGAKKV